MKEFIQAEHLNIKYLNKAPADKLREIKNWFAESHPLNRSTLLSKSFHAYIARCIHIKLF